MNSNQTSTQFPDFMQDPALSRPVKEFLKALFSDDDTATALLHKPFKIIINL